MISTIEHIRYLILMHDCVIVPGFGAFVSRYIPAELSADGTRLSAPQRELGFNSALSHDDGLLIGSITRREGVSYECARGIVEQEVELIQRRLRNEGTLLLPRVGTLSLTPHLTIDFVPAANCVAALPFFGLPDITIAEEPVNELIAGEQSEAETVETALVKAPRIMRRIQPWKYVAAAAMLAGVCLTFLTPVAPKNFSFASLQPNVAISQPCPEEIVRPINLPADRRILISRPDSEEATGKALSEKKKLMIRQIAEYREKMVASKQAERDVQESFSAAKVSATGKNIGLKSSAKKTEGAYHVIVASCASMQEAQRYISRHGAGGHLQVIPSDGRFRISMASAPDMATAQAFRSSLSASHPDAWIYCNR